MIVREQIPNLKIIYDAYSTIEEILGEKKMPLFRNSTLDDVLNWKEYDYCIAGGSIQSAMSKTTIKDIDVFTTDYKRSVSVFKAAGHVPTFSNDKVTNFKIRNLIYQIVDHPFRYAQYETLRNEFDFTVACAVVYRSQFEEDDFGFVLDAHDRFFQDLASKRLVVNKITFPLSSLERLTKYVAKGFTPCPVGLLELAKSLNALEIDWDNPDQNTLVFYPGGGIRFTGVD